MSRRDVLGCRKLAVCDGHTALTFGVTLIAKQGINQDDLLKRYLTGRIAVSCCGLSHWPAPGTFLFLSSVASLIDQRVSQPGTWLTSAVRAFIREFPMPVPELDSVPQPSNTLPSLP